MRKCIKNYKCIATRLYNKFFFHRPKDGHHGRVDRLHYMLKNQSLGSLLGKKWQQSLSSHRSVTEAYGVGGTSGKCSHFSCMEKELKKMIISSKVFKFTRYPPYYSLSLYYLFITLQCNVSFQRVGGGF